MGTKSSEKSAKNVFYIHTNIVTKKWGGKNARDNFSRNTRIVRAKIVGKNRMKKVRKNDFLYLHEYGDQKMGEKKRETIFHEHTYSAGKKCWEKLSVKGGKKVFYIHTNIVTKKWRERNARKIFPETHD